MLQEADIVQDWINEGIEKGIGIGTEKVIRDAILDVLSARFGVITKEISKKLGAVDDAAVLRSLHRKSVKVESLEEFIRLLGELQS